MELGDLVVGVLPLLSPEVVAVEVGVLVAEVRAALGSREHLGDGSVGEVRRRAGHEVEDELGSVGKPHAQRLGGLGGLPGRDDRADPRPVARLEAQSRFERAHVFGERPERADARGDDEPADDAQNVDARVEPAVPEAFGAPVLVVRVGAAEPRRERDDVPEATSLCAVEAGRPQHLGREPRVEDRPDPGLRGEHPLRVRSVLGRGLLDEDAHPGVASPHRVDDRGVRARRGRHDDEVGGIGKGVA